MFLKRLKKLHSQKGAMDSILVTLILIILALGLVVGLLAWYSNQEETMQNAATDTVTNAINAVSEQ